MKRTILLIILMLGCVLMANSCEKNEKGYAQLQPPKKGDPIAIIKTSMGDITIRLFPDEAPKTVENFTNHAKNGYYDGVIFHRVMDTFMIQTGDPTGTGSGGETWNGEVLVDEVSVGMHHIRGAVSMANANSADYDRWNTNGSQFFIVQNKSIGDGLTQRFQKALDDTKDSLRDNIPPDFLQHYIDNGGTPHLDSPGLPEYSSKHSVFGQVIEGWDVLDAIAAARVQATRPVEDISITTIEITEYK